MSKAYELVGASMGALVASLGLTAQALEQMVKALPRVKEE
jgi:predicted acylesterase/phospholipase RssA